MTALILGLLFAIIVVPVGAQAAQVVSAITDPGGINQATVDADGNLSVAGNVTVDSSTPVGVTSADDPGRMAFTDQRLITILSGSFSAIATIDVPAGKRLVITHVSGEIVLPTGQRPRTIALNVHTGGSNAVHRLVPTFTAPTPIHDYFAFSQNAMIYAEDQFTYEVLRNTTGGEADAFVQISGYLIDCEVAACN